MNNIDRDKKDLPPEQCVELLRALNARFEKNMNRLESSCRHAAQHCAGD
jgi:hypothetical protein